MKKIKPHTRFKRFVKDVVIHTPFIKMIFLLIVLWLMFSGGLFWAEEGDNATPIRSFGDALYWGIAAFSTAGIADTPQSNLAKLIGGIWIILGSVLFFWNHSGDCYNVFYAPHATSRKKNNRYH